MKKTLFRTVIPLSILGLSLGIVSALGQGATTTIEFFNNKSENIDTYDLQRRV